MQRRVAPGGVQGKAGFRQALFPAWLIRIARAAWRGLREWCGDSAYERYLRSKATRDADCRRLSPAEFYAEQLNRRYSRPNRCC